MALPPRGDPRRPLHLAIRSTRLLGGLFVLFSFCAMTPLLFPASFGGSARGASVYVASAAAVYFVPGLLYIVFSIYLAQRKFWAVVGAIILASIQLLFVLISLLLAMIVVFAPHSSPGALMIIPLAVIALMGAALGQLTYHLAKSFEAIRYTPWGQEERGFEPIAVRPAGAAPEAQALGGAGNRSD
jgi:hypothetical protein